MAADPQDEESIFHAALARPVAERAAYVQAACGSDPELLAQIESLLTAYEVHDDFLEAPPAGEAVVPGDSLVTEGPGTVIGRYKLLEKIGEGGMAVVYMAEQTEPIRRKAALKIIKLGMDTRQVIARFEAERQALALMDHPSIAKVLDAGATETGRPYFVMELVQGVSITEYCDKKNLSTKDRLALFLQVCHAVQHAHQKGIIHRDLKPSNVMVTHLDGRPLPKVIDFGIAKATNQRLTEKTLFTRYAHIIGTPAYMSPEQAELSDLDIDTRSDIYSLGVLLYELLTGTTPFSEKELRKAGYIEMQRVIREQEPAKPSTKLSTLGDALTDVAKHRGCAPDLLRKAIRGDLDWIVMKSLEKDRARRYETASGLGDDIRRHLESQPVLARGPSTTYRLRKFLCRHRVQASSVLAIMVLGSVAVVALTLWNRDRLHLGEAESRRHNEILSQARKHFERRDHAPALKAVQPILASKYVGQPSRLLQDQILNDLHERVSQCTRRIEADPLDASAYSDRAHYYDCLHDGATAQADMAIWSAIHRQRAFWNSCFGETWDVRRVINLPFECQLVFSAERPVSEIPVVNVAFGQKGKSEMKLFEIPVWVVPLFGVCFLSSVAAPPAQADFTFGVPEPAAPLRYNEWINCLSYDGLEMYTEAPGVTDQQGTFDLWIRKRASKNEDWGPVENLGPLVNSASADHGACISSDGLTLYFLSPRPGGYGGTDIYTTTRATRDDPWGPAVNLGPTINSSSTDRMVWISADNLELYFGSNRPGGYGASDIYVARRATTNAPWGAPVNLGPVVNTPYGECYVSLSPDGLLLVFSEWYTTTNVRPGGHGTPDIWMTRRTSLSAPWQTPVNLGTPVNGPTNDFSPSISSDGHTLYFSSLDRSGGPNWQAPIIPLVDFNADRKVDLVDLVMLIDAWGTSNSVCDIGPMPWGDGQVDIEDLKVFMTYYEKGNPRVKP
jgi:serine/threonine protein kinase